MLQAFGFTVQATDNSAEALARAASPSLLLLGFVSAELPADANTDGNGLNLCSQLRQADARSDGNRTVLVLVVENLRPMDRVRAELAGCDVALPAPITRGGVARLLNARGIDLPADPRRN